MKTAQAPAIADKLAAKLSGAKQDQAVTLQLRITDPASAWVLNLGPQGGSIRAEATVGMIAERRASDEGKEGIAAFLDKRPPEWPAS